jgi:hypothetical protein
MVFEWQARKYEFFPEIYIKNDQAMRKSPEHVP